MSLSKSIFTISFFTILSRISGYIRDVFIAAFMGAGPLTDAFLIAFRLPNFFRRLFAEGAFNAAFVPLFAGILNEEGKVTAELFLKKVMSLMIVSLVGLTMVFQIFMPFIMYGFAPGFADNPEQFDLAVHLTRITFPYLIFISVVSLFGGVLNTTGKFATAAASPVLLNLCLIFGLFAFTSFTDTPAHSLAWGVALAGIVQIIFLYFSLKRQGYLPKFVRPELNPKIKRLLKLMIPGVIGAGVVQINLWIDTIIATLIPNAVSYLYYADRINQLPLAVVGTAVGTALLPMLAKQFKEGKRAGAISTENRALEIAMFFTIPAAAALFILAHPIIAVLFERGKFTGAESIATSYALSTYALGLPAFVLIKILVTPFFAEQDTKTPVVYSAISMAINVVLNLGFYLWFIAAGWPAYVGIALATVISSWLNALMLGVTLYKKEKLKFDEMFKTRIFGIVVSALIMSLVLVMIMADATGYFTDSSGELGRTTVLAIIIALGGGSYFISGYFVKAYDFKVLRKFLRKG